MYEPTNEDLKIINNLISNMNYYEIMNILSRAYEGSENDLEAYRGKLIKISSKISNRLNWGE